MWRGTSSQLTESTALRRLDDTFPETEVFADAQPLTVRLRGVMIQEQRDRFLRGDNDLMVVTKSQFGNEPPIQRLHFMGKEAGTGWHGDFFHDVVLSLRDLTDERLKLMVQVYDLDGVPDDLVESVSTFASETTAVLFPHLAPYAGLVGMSAESLLDLVDNIDDHDRILDERVTLELADPGTGHDLLQPGYFVCLDDPIDGEPVLDRDFRVTTAGEGTYGGSYAVFEVAREHLEGRQWEVDQKAAKLMAELNGKGQSEKASVDFLRDTLDIYTKFKKLRRANELQSKESLTSAEENLLNDLKANEALAPYLNE